MKKLIIVSILAMLTLLAIRSFAGTLTEQQSQGYVQGNDTFSVATATYAISVTGSNRYSANLVITNGGNTSVSFPNVTLPGRIFGKDTSATNIAGMVRFSVDGTNWLVGANPNEPYSFRMVTNQSFIAVSVSSTQSHTIQINVLSQ